MHKQCIILFLALNTQKMSRPYRDRAPRPVQSFSDTEARLRELEDDNRRKHRVVVVLLILGTLTFLGYGLWILLANRDRMSDDARIDAKIDDVRSDLTQLVVEGSETITIIQNGTFRWAISGTAGGDGCLDSDNFLNSPQEYITSTYTLENIQSGSLNFTVLVLDPPSDSLVMASSSADVRVCMTSFDPIMNIVDDIGSNGPATFPFTRSNLLRLSITPDCWTAETCSVQPAAASDFNPKDTYSVTSSPGSSFGDPSGINGYLYYYYTPVSGTGSAITITESLKLVLLSS